MYQTIILEMLKQYPTVHETLRQQRQLLLVMKQLAEELKARHDEWQRIYSTTDTGIENPQVQSETLELAIQDLKDHLALESNPEELNLETIMACLRAATANG